MCAHILSDDRALESFSVHPSLLVGNQLSDYSTIGFWQILYVLPLVLWLKRRRFSGVSLGVLVGSAIMFTFSLAVIVNL